MISDRVEPVPTGAGRDDFHGVPFVFRVECGVVERRTGDRGLSIMNGLVVRSDVRI